MKALVYVDHSVFARESNWPELERLSISDEFELVFSLWNLVEIGRGSDPKQIVDRASFIDRLKPRWIVERLTSQQSEIRCCVDRWSGGQSEPIRMVVPHLSIVLSYLDGDGRSLGITARRFLEETDVKALVGPMNDSASALASLQKASAKQRRVVEPIAFRGWMYGLLERDAHNKPVPRRRRLNLSRDCLQRKRDVLTACRAIAAEDALYQLRTNDPSRRPRPSDGPDLQHSVMALAYCDVFLSNDGYVQNCAQSIRGYPGVKGTRLVRSPRELV